MIDPRQPVIIGGATVIERGGDAEPIAMMENACRLAAGDCGVPALLDKVGSVRVVLGMWPYQNPGAMLSERLGIRSPQSVLTGFGGNEVLDLVTHTAESIQRGDLDVSLICSAETMRTRRSTKAAGSLAEYLPEETGGPPDLVVGAKKKLADGRIDRTEAHEWVNFYAMVESAIRHRRSASVPAHLERVASMWARASDVAAENPDAWLRRQFSPDEIATPSDTNRLVASPYPKLMTSNVDVDMGGAVLMCSAAVAEAAGVSQDRWIFVRSGAGAEDHWSPTQRWELDRSPAMRFAGRAALELAGLAADEITYLDLYSCFPAAVQVAQMELQVDPARPFTITGGLTFAGGPLNSYCMLPLVRSLDLLRSGVDGEASALLTGNGGYFQKHSFTVLSGEPGASGFRSARPQQAVDDLPRRPSADLVEGPTSGVIEAHTVTYQRAGAPSQGLIAALDANGYRYWLTTTDAAFMALLAGQDCVSEPITFDPASSAVLL